MKTPLITVIIALLAIFSAGYGAGAWYAKRQADQYWTDAAVRKYIAHNNIANPPPKQTLSFQCQNELYVYDVESGVIEPHEVKQTLAGEVPKPTSNEALLISAALGLKSWPEFQKTTKNMKGFWLVLGAVSGFTAGYHAFVEEIPDCNRDSVQKVVNDSQFWQRLADARWAVTPVKQPVDIPWPRPSPRAGARK